MVRKIFIILMLVVSWGVLAEAAIVHQEAVTGTASSTTAVSSSTQISGGANQFYVAVIGNRSNKDVTSVSGGGLTWTERRDQCAGRNQTAVAIYTAYGSPGAAFTVTANLGATAAEITLSAHRYSGVDSTTPYEDVVGQNSVGENDATCTGGTDSSTTTLTTGSTGANSIHFCAATVRTRTVSTADADYTQRANVGTGSGGDVTRTYVHEYEKAGTGDDICSHSLSGTTDWATVGFVIVPTAAASGPLKGAIMIVN